MSGNIAEQVPGPYEDTTCQMVASYGDPDHPQLNDLRTFRDETLTSSWLGRRLVSIYYFITPYTVNLAKRSALARFLTITCIGRPLHALSRLAE